MNKPTRPYAQKRRAAQQAMTRHRIVDATVDLHGSVGPAATTVTMIAERAGVQRHTVYAHFPDERDLFLACSGRAMERDPLPDSAGWQAIADPHARRAAGIAALYAWYDRNERLAACVLRDGEHHALTREIIALRMAPVLAGYRAVLGEGLDRASGALLDLALSFHTWRTLVREAGLAADAAVAAMVDAIAGRAESRNPKGRKGARRGTAR